MQKIKYHLIRQELSQAKIAVQSRNNKLKWILGNQYTMRCDMKLTIRNGLAADEEIREFLPFDKVILRGRSINKEG